MKLLVRQFLVDVGGVDYTVVVTDHATRHPFGSTYAVESGIEIEVLEDCSDDVYDKIVDKVMDTV